MIPYLWEWFTHEDHHLLFVEPWQNCVTHALGFDVSMLLGGAPKVRALQAKYVSLLPQVR